MPWSKLSTYTKNQLIGRASIMGGILCPMRMRREGSMPAPAGAGSVTMRLWASWMKSTALIHPIGQVRMRTRIGGPEVGRPAAFRETVRSRTK